VDVTRQGGDLDRRVRQSALVPTTQRPRGALHYLPESLADECRLVFPEEAGRYRNPSGCSHIRNYSEELCPAGVDATLRLFRFHSGSGVRPDHVARALYKMPASEFSAGEHADPSASMPPVRTWLTDAFKISAFTALYPARIFCDASPQRMVAYCSNRYWTGG